MTATAVPIRRLLEDSRLAYILSRMGPGMEKTEFQGAHSDLIGEAERVNSQVFGYSPDGHYHGPFETAPLFELYHRERCIMYSDRPYVDKIARRLVAMQRDVTKIVDDHVRYRHEHEGNVVFEWMGPTGQAKSSCKLAFQEKFNGLRKAVQQGGVDALRKRLTIDIQHLPRMLKDTQAGDSIDIDEQNRQVGEGSRTWADLLANLEDTIRGHQVDIHFASPGRREGHGTSQAILESIAWSPTTLADGRAGRKEGLFLLSLGLNGEEATPLGVVVVPWASQEVWRAYSILKRENLDRSVRMQFHAASASEETIKALFDEPAVLALASIKRPEKSDWQRYLRAWGHSMSTGEQATIAATILEMMHVLRTSGPHLFKQIWEWEPTPNMIGAATGKQQEGSAGGITEI